jgi:hypothetical protein
MNVEIGTEAAKFPEKEYINGIFVAVCVSGVTARAPWSRNPAGQPLCASLPSKEKRRRGFRKGLRCFRKEWGRGGGGGQLVEGGGVRRPFPVGQPPAPHPTCPRVWWIGVMDEITLNFRQGQPGATSRRSCGGPNARGHLTMRGLCHRHFLFLVAKSWNRSQILQTLCPPSPFPSGYAPKDEGGGAIWPI